MKLFLLRHGLTEANERRLYYGRTDLPLSEAGRAALRACAAPPAVVRYFTSGLLRTEQTLEILCGSVPHTALPGLREMDFGAFEMKSYSELKDDPDFRRWCEACLFVIWFYRDIWTIRSASWIGLQIIFRAKKFSSLS